MADNDRLMGDWFSSSTTRNDKIRTSLRTMRNRSRQLAENDEHAINYLEMCRNNIVGANGILLKMMVRDDNGSLDQRANDIILEAWQEWCKPENCTVTRGISWWELQRLLATEEPQAGEVFVRMVLDFKNPFGFALQTIEADCVDEELNIRLDNGNKIRMGKEHNPWGEIVAYWVRTENPYDTLSTDIKHERILAKEMLHKYIPLGLKDVRGIPWFHAPGRSMRMLHEYDFSAMVAARMGADNRGFFEKVPDANGEYKGDGEDEKGNTVSSLGPGQMEELPEGIKFNQVESDYPHAQYGPFTKVHQRRIATGLRGANYNQLTGDYESVNYSSLRAAFLDSRDVWKSLQCDRIIKIDLPIFKVWLKQALLYRAIPLPADKLKKFNARNSSAAAGVGSIQRPKSQPQPNLSYRVLRADRPWSPATAATSIMSALSKKTIASSPRVTRSILKPSATLCRRIFWASSAAAALSRRAALMKRKSAGGLEWRRRPMKLKRHGIRAMASDCRSRCKLRTISNWAITARLRRQPIRRPRSKNPVTTFCGMRIAWRKAASGEQSHRRNSVSAEGETPAPDHSARP
jgi:lambda family phage portal protein